MSNLITPISLCPKCNNTFNVSESHTYPPVSVIDFRSNVVPFTEVHTRITRIVADEELELARYDQEITRLRRIIDQLELERSTLQTRIAHRRSFISSRRRLPNELWSDIFDLVCGSEEYSLVVDYDSTVQAALPSLLSGISTRWRGIIKSLPHLWSSISIDIWLQDKPGIHALLEQYLRNAADFPLTVQMRYSGPYHCQNFPENSLAVLQLLFRNIARCKVLDIANLTNNPELMTLVSSPAVSFPLMRSIRMCFASYEENPQFWDTVRAAPRLTHAAVVGLSLIRFLPLGRLVSLDISVIHSTAPILDILRECSSLQILKMTGLELSNLNIGHASQPITLPCLQCLSLDFWWYTNDLEELLKALVLPSLISLKLLNTYRGEQNAVFQVVPLLLPFSQSLAKVSFSLGRMGLPRGHIGQTFRAFPYLTDFEICYSGETDSEDSVGITHELLLILGADSLVAPHLGSLWLREHKSPFEVELVEAAIALLEGQFRPLKCIQLGFEGDGRWLPAELLARMRNLKERGMECIIEFLD
ncbi:hypothetical protein Moror_16385 [Moniliophthora roreri MCA 2997]|uniref:F-box domain-containing protein n=2 Tax=Moniliophthora roreri TaxID=221103 RepID=V2XB82_MONRO|nr:hypothetical protein Moror_16385 [Moniliophthora roreri MCA 2997]